MKVPYSRDRKEPRVFCQQCQKPVEEIDYDTGIEAAGTYTSMVALFVETRGPSAEARCHGDGWILSPGDIKKLGNGESITVFVTDRTSPDYRGDAPRIPNYRGDPYIPMTEGDALKAAQRVFKERTRLPTPTPIFYNKTRGDVNMVESTFGSRGLKTYDGIDTTEKKKPEPQTPANNSRFKHLDFEDDKEGRK